MSEDQPVQQPAGQQTLLQELDTRQNQLLDDLDALNRQIEGLLGEWTKKRQGSGLPFTPPVARPVEGPVVEGGPAGVPAVSGLG